MSRSRNRKTSKNVMVGLSVLALASLRAVSPAQALTLNCFQPLVFGEIMTCGVSNTVVVTPGNARTVNGCLDAGGSPFSRARCNVRQKFPFKPIQISITTPTIALNNGTDSINVDNFHMLTNAGPIQTTETVANFNLPIGATLNIETPQGSGTYTGSFVVTANYI